MTKPLTGVALKSLNGDLVPYKECGLQLGISPTKYTPGEGVIPLLVIHRQEASL